MEGNNPVRVIICCVCLGSASAANFQPESAIDSSNVAASKPGFAKVDFKLA